MFQNIDESEMVNAYYHTIHNTLYSIDGIVPIFMYLVSNNSKIYEKNKYNNSVHLIRNTKHQEI